MVNDKLCPVEIEFADKTQLTSSLLSYSKGSKVVLIIWEGMVRFLGLEDLIEQMMAKYELIWLDENIANPTQQDVRNAVLKIGAGKPEKLICIGGGSAIDTGKGISALYDYIHLDTTIDEITAVIKSKDYDKNLKPIDIIAVPTTAGTGSEVTKWATIWDVGKNEKFSIDMNELYPAKAIICTELTMSVPIKLVLSTGLDAMAHAMEAFWSRASSPVVKDISEIAIRKIHKNLEPALKDLTNYKCREELCRASLLAGIAFSNTRTTACHSISYPITMRFGVDHGYAVAMQLNEVMKINQAAVSEIESVLLPIFEGDGGFDTWITKVSKDIQPLRLSAFGIKEENIDEIVELSFTAGRMNNNPVDISKEEVGTILRNIL